jgi:para-nitrobenzyl esterase
MESQEIMKRITMAGVLMAVTAVTNVMATAATAGAMGGSTVVGAMAAAATAGATAGATTGALVGSSVETNSGRLSGMAIDGEVIVFKGVPYAAPPVGGLRWKAPEPPASWKGVRAATEFGPACVQPRSTTVGVYTDDPAHMSEDCLYLNIWQPTKVKSGAPVMLWIHGGAFRSGHTASQIYDGTELARRGVVIVSTSYRMGILGFLAHPQLSAESPQQVSGNYGLLDQIAALKWVKENIEAFGGDPSNVTIFGESAGALSVMDLVASPQGRGLFSKAIAESGYMVSNTELRKSRYGLPSAEDVGVAIAKALGAGTVAELRKRDAVELIEASSKGGYVPLPVVDGWLLPDQLVDIYDRGEQNHVPMLVGFNAGELRSLRVLLPPTPATAAEYEKQVRERFKDLGDAYLKQYPSSNVPDSVLAASRDGLYGWTAQRLAAKQAAIGQPSYLYFFTHSYPAEGADLLAFHASEIPFVFGQIGPKVQLPGTWPRPPDAAGERALSNAMMDYWTSFARTGVPSPTWKAYAEGESYMELGAKPVPSAHLLPGMYALTEELISRRRRAPDQFWFTNIGLATPPTRVPQ